ncbi:hypothetical protein FFLO_04812 [Filobasidium floriforme]|uniref:Beta-hexosaminidase n=1 Tax=Filobasidium floriforme TaxID=5210 RepID=A0A8K0JNK8_9TREE|nr:hypothetical protein FFLO_04812 [Filobasidium floriforme]
MSFWLQAALFLLLGHRTMALLFPLPQTVTSGNTVIAIGNSLDVIFKVQGSIPEDLAAAAERAVGYVTESEHYYLSPERGKEFLLDNDLPVLTALEIILQGSDYGTIASEVSKEAGERREAYKLDIPADGGNARLTATSSLGAFRGLATFEQLFYGVPPTDDGKAADLLSPGSQEVFGQRIRYKAFSPAAPYHIEDRPAFPWRGFMLDTSRHYFSKETILRTLDAMALVKLNVFHWHMTDSQSWPLSLPGFRDLAEKGAYSARETYNEEDVGEITKYAAERGIDVVVEMDMPGHTASSHHARPELVVGYAREPWTRYAAQPPAGQLRYMEDDVTQLMVDLLGKLKAHIPSAYFATGGDEINENVYKDDDRSQATLKRKGWTLKQALNAFMGSTWQALQPKIPVVWQEMVQEHRVDSLPDNAVVLIWKSSKDVSKIAKLGHPIVHVGFDHMYLDLGGGGNIIPPLGKKEPSWHAHPFNTWYHIYSFDPYKGVKANQRHLVLGGQTVLWSETTDETNVDSKIWPRAAAIAEIYWSGGGDNGFPLDPSKALARFQDLRYRLVAKGVSATPLQPHWCAIRPGSCEFI